ncbi:rRNA-binding ribosome biosynthesis protein utp25 [Cryptotrichosporon argae]
MSAATELKLLTLLNVSSIKRPRDLDIPGGHRSPALSREASADVSAVADDGARPKKRKSVVWGGEVGPSGSTYVEGKQSKRKGKGKEADAAVDCSASEGDGYTSTGRAKLDGLEVDNDDENALEQDMFNTHFGAAPSVLSPDNVAAADGGKWTSKRVNLRGYGRAFEFAASTGEREAGSTRIVPSLVSSLEARVSTLPAQTSTCLAHLGTYRDFYVHSLDGEADGSERAVLGDAREAWRAAVGVHAVNHVLKTRRRIIRNNERLAHAPDAETPRDQSFTRPKVLLLVPVRSAALHWLNTHILPLAPADTQIENRRPFEASFALPADAADPLDDTAATAEFALDHLANFRGNSDDNFRIGLKFTRKAWRVVMMPANEAKLMECDILVASPLALKMAAEREDSTDLLSSIEICVADGLDVMQMQNWDHVQFVLNHLNEIPKSPHGCDFSRVKPWYLDGNARFLRQTLLFGRYDTPEARAVFSRSCVNLEGKVRLEGPEYPGVLGRVREGVRQVFERCDLERKTGEVLVDEVEQRLEHFTKKTLPALLRSAVSRQNTLVVVPSYFDFVRLVAHLRKADTVSFAAVSEYSSNAEISRARTTFFKGSKAMLIVTERFHFYRRYKLRGARTVVFYALPEHAQFYAEFLAHPFIAKPGQAAPEPEDVSARVLFSRLDALRLERVVGKEDARRMLGSEEARFEFV